MAENILEAVRQHLGHEPIQKIDPNSQEAKHVEALSADGKLAQAVIPAVLTAFSVFAKSDDGAQQVLSRASISLDDLFAGNKDKIIRSVAEYSGASDEEVEGSMEKITQAATTITLNAAGPEPTADKIRTYLAGQRHTILTRLPASLQLGKMLDDNSLDDRTNKMEGPMSNIAHAIENAMSGSEKPKELKS